MSLLGPMSNDTNLGEIKSGRSVPLKTEGERGGGEERAEDRKRENLLVKRKELLDSRAAVQYLYEI
jgi:hypothetical protein